MDSTHPARASSTSATACSTVSELSQKNVMFATVPVRRPVRPIRCKNDDTVLGASAWNTASRSPTSIPSSSVEVQAIQTFVPWWKEASAARRSSNDTELW